MKNRNRLISHLRTSFCALVIIGVLSAFPSAEAGGPPLPASGEFFPCFNYAGPPRQVGENGQTAIVPVVIREEIDLCRLCKALLENGIYINPVLRPAAAQNLLRISCTAAHTEAHVERLVATLIRLADELGIER